MVVYADSSFLVSLLVEGQNSSLSKNYLIRNPEPVSFTSFSRSETPHAIRTLAFRKEIDSGEMTRALLQFEDDESQGFLRFIAPEEVSLFETANRLSQRYALELGVRFLDVLHVASALLAKADFFLTFDRRQAKLAKAVGLRVKP